MPVCSVQSPTYVVFSNTPQLLTPLILTRLFLANGYPQIDGQEKKKEEKNMAPGEATQCSNATGHRQLGYLVAS